MGVTTVDQPTVMETVESKYRFERTNNGRGYIVSAPNRLSVYFGLSDNNKAFNVYNPNESRKKVDIGLYHHHDIITIISNSLMNEWKPQGKYKGRKIYEWAKVQCKKALAKKISTKLNELKERVDPLVLNVQKAVFAASSRIPPYVLSDQFYKLNPYYLKDICQYRAASLSVHFSIDYATVCNNNFDRSKTLPPFIPFGKHFQFSDCDFEKYHEVVPDGDWRVFYAHEQEVYTSLNRTLINLPGGLPPRIYINIALHRLPRPITDRIELGIACSYKDYTGEKRFRDIENIFLNATRKDILRAAKRIGDHTRSPLNMRKSHVFGEIAQFITDAAHHIEIHKGMNISGLALRAIDWHRNHRYDQSKKIAKYKDEATPTKLPPVPLPEDKHIRFLKTVGEVWQEGDDLHHCVASYSDRAVRGETFLFHIEKDNSIATAEVSPMGIVLQVKGPRNTNNKACEYGRRVLKKWGNAFPNGVQQVFAGLTIEDEEVPF